MKDDVGWDETRQYTGCENLSASKMPPIQNVYAPEMGEGDRLSRLYDVMWEVPMAWNDTGTLC